MNDYTPKSEHQLAEEGLLKKGRYDFEVDSTSDKLSKAGNPMFTLKLRLFQEDGTSYYLTDYIALGSNFGERKLRHAADACGILDVYESGKLKASDFMARSGKVDVKIQEGNIEYPNPKNAVDAYVKREKQPEAAKDLKKELNDDDVPF